MRGTRLLRLILVVALAVSGAVSGTASAAKCTGGGWGNGGIASTCPGFLKWTYDPRSHEFHGESALAGLQRDLYEYREVADCDSNTVDTPFEALCMRAISCPVRVDSNGDRLASLRIVVYRRAIGSTAPWLEAQTACRYYGRTVTLAEVQTAARQEIERHVGHPSISVQPPGGQTLVNIPTLFSAAEQRTTTLPITAPVPGQIKAVPSYSWTFGDGLTGAGSGHPFTPSIVPNETGNNGYYVVAVYRQPGTKSITATLRWDVTFTLQGFGTITLAPIVFTDTVQLNARTARAVLVNH